METAVSRFTSDGYILLGIELDTGKYNVTNNLRAFGVRAQYAIDARFTSSEELSLFLHHDGDIKEILSNVMVKTEFHKVMPPDCEDDTREATRYLSVLSSTSSGFNDFAFVEKVVDTTLFKKIDTAVSCLTSYNK